MRVVKLALWFMVKNFVNSVKRQWKIYLGLGIFIAAIVLIGFIADNFGSASEEPGANTEISEETEEPYVPNPQLDLVIDDDGCILYENGEIYDIGSLITAAVGCVVVWIFIVLGIVGGSKNGVNIFDMQDVNFLFPAPIKPQSVLLFKMICQIGTSLMGSLYILYQIPNLINMGMNIWGALLLVIGFIVLTMVNKFIGVFSYIFLSRRENLKKFVGKYGFCFMALPIAIPAVLHFGLGLGIYESLNTVFGSVGAYCIPFVGWLMAYTVYAVSGEYLLCGLFMLLTLVGTGLLISVTWRMDCDFYEDAFANAIVLEDAKEQIKYAAAGGMSYGVKHEGRAGKVWEKRRNKKLSFEGYEGASVFFAKTILNRKRMYRLGGLWSSTASVYFWICTGAGLFMRFIVKEISPLALTLVPMFICLVCMFFRSFFNPLQQDLSHNFIYMIPESPFALIGWGMGGQVLDGALDLIPATVVISVISLHPGYGLSCGLLLLSMHVFFGMTALLVNLIISSYLPKILSNILQGIVRMLPFFPVVLAFILGLFAGNVYIAFLGVILVNVCVSLLVYIPCPFFLHSGKR